MSETWLTPVVGEKASGVLILLIKQEVVDEVAWVVFRTTL